MVRRYLRESVVVLCCSCVSIAGPLTSAGVKERKLERGDSLTIDTQSAATPAQPPIVEITRGDHTLYLPTSYAAPAAAGAPGVVSARIGALAPFGKYSAALLWESSRWPLGEIWINPTGNPGVHLKAALPPQTYDIQTTFVPDPADRTAEKIAVGDYSVAVNRSRLPDLAVRWRGAVFQPLLNGCVYVPPNGAANNPVAPPARFYARDKGATIELCSIPTDAKIELAGADAGATQLGNAQEAWIVKPKTGIAQSVVSVALHGSGFQVANPRDNAIWINGIRQEGVVWDTCSNSIAHGAADAPQPVAIHGEVINAEEIRLCSVPVAANGRLLLAAGYGDTQSESAELRVFSMGRASVVTWSMVIAAILALLPLGLLSTVNRSYRIANADYKWRMLFLDPETDTYSLSKLQFYLWTNAAIFSYAYLFISRVKVQGAAWPDIPTTLPGIIAVAGGTAVGAQIVTSNKGSKGSGDEKPSLADFITSGGVVAADRLQMFLWTLFGVAAFLYAVWELMPGSITELPAVPERLLVLMGISSAGYLGGKMARKAGPVINELTVTPPDSDTQIRKATAQGPELPDLVEAVTGAQIRLGKLAAPSNASAKTAVDTFSQAVKAASAAHTMSEFRQLVADLAGKRTAAESAALQAAADFEAGKATQAEAETAQAAAAGLQDFSADVGQAIAASTAAVVEAESSPAPIKRTIDLRGTNLSAEAMFAIDHADLPFRMLVDKDGKQLPEVLAREDATPTFARLLRLTIDPARLSTSDQEQVEKWFGEGGRRAFTITNPDGQKSEVTFDLPPAVAQKAGS
jgi:hypothetical protein